MIEATAAVNLRGLRRGELALVDETDERVKGYIRAGYLIPESHVSPPPEVEADPQPEVEAPVTPTRPAAKNP